MRKRELRRLNADSTSMSCTIYANLALAISQNMHHMLFVQLRRAWYGDTVLVTVHNLLRRLAYHLVANHHLLAFTVTYSLLVLKSTLLEMPPDSRRTTFAESAPQDQTGEGLWEAYLDAVEDEDKANVESWNGSTTGILTFVRS